MFVANDSSRVIAKALVPLTKAEKMEDFIRGLEPIRLGSRVRDTKK
jgi:hypothetical protein